MNSNDKTPPRYATVVGWTVAVGIVALVVLGVIAVAKAVL